MKMSSTTDVQMLYYIKCCVQAVNVVYRLKFRSFMIWDPPKPKFFSERGVQLYGYSSYISIKLYRDSNEACEFCAVFPYGYLMPILLESEK